MRDYLLRRSLRRGSRRSLAARGQFVNNFAGIAYCLAFSLLALGGYGIEDQFANPLEAYPAGLLLSALLIATAASLLYLLLPPFRQRGHRIAPRPAGIFWGEESAAVKSATRSEENRWKAVPLHGRYIDHALVRIQRPARITPGEWPGSNALPESTGDEAHARPQ